MRKSELEHNDNDKAKTSMIALGPTQFGRPVGEGLVGVLLQDGPNDNELSLQLDQDSSCPSFSDCDIGKSSKDNDCDKATGYEQAAEVKKGRNGRAKEIKKLRTKLWKTIKRTRALRRKQMG